MKRCVLFIITLTLISTLAVAQAVVTPSGQATMGGVAVPVAPLNSPPQVTAPLIHLGNAATVPAGSPANPNAEPPSAVPIRTEIDLGPETIYLGQPNVAANSANVVNTAAPAAGHVDLGVNSNAAVSVSDGTNGRSLGDIARENRQRMQGANARTFTNADVQRMAGAGGVSGIATNPANNAYPPDNGVINSNGAVAVPANTATEQNVPQATPPATEQNQKPSAATPPPQMAQAQTPANPADQNGQANAQENNQRTLPKSGSPLPLLAVLGVVAGGAGLVVRKLRT